LVRRFLSVFLILAALFLLYFWRLGTLTTGLGSTENDARHSSTQIHSIITQPANAPQKIIQYSFQAAGQSGAFWMRLSSVIFALILTACFYFLARAWFGKFIGALGTLLFATTPWLILLSRSATPGILLLAPVSILAAYVYLTRAQGRWRWPAWLWLMASIALALYVPGLAWLIVIGAVFSWRQIVGVIQNLPPLWLSSGILLFLVLIGPLGWAISKDWTVIKPLLLIPPTWPNNLEDLSTIGWSGLALIWRARQHMDLLIGRLPILDITQIALLFFGLSAMWRRARAEMYGLMALAVFGILAAGLNRDLVLLTLCLPAISLISAAGLRYLLIEWRQVFPRNPLPKALVLVLMCTLVALHALYGVRYALIAWPHTLDTRNTYVIK
jgi:hypothetical protein